MTLLLKDPDAVLDYSVDWGAEYRDEDRLTDSQWTVSPVEPDGVSVVTSRFDYATTTVTASGGVPGRIYRLDNRVVTASGRTDGRSVVLRVEQR